MHQPNATLACYKSYAYKFPKYLAILHFQMSEDLLLLAHSHILDYVAYFLDYKNTMNKSPDIFKEQSEVKSIVFKCNLDKSFSRFTNL